MFFFFLERLATGTACGYRTHALVFGTGPITGRIPPPVQAQSYTPVVAPARTSGSAPPAM